MLSKSTASLLFCSESCHRTDILIRAPFSCSLEFRAEALPSSLRDLYCLYPRTGLKENSQPYSPKSSQCKKQFTLRINCEMHSYKCFIIIFYLSLVQEVDIFLLTQSPLSHYQCESSRDKTANWFPCLL